MVEKMLSCKFFVLGGCFSEKAWHQSQWFLRVNLIPYPLLKQDCINRIRLVQVIPVVQKLWPLRHDWPLLDTLSDFAIAKCHEFEAPDLAISAWSWAKLEAETHAEMNLLGIFPWGNRWFFSGSKATADGPGYSDLMVRRFFFDCTGFSCRYWCVFLLKEPFVVPLWFQWMILDHKMPEPWKFSLGFSNDHWVVGSGIV